MDRNVVPVAHRGWEHHHTKRQALSGVTDGLTSAGGKASNHVSNATASLSQTKLIGLICGVACFVLLCGWALWRCSARRAARRKGAKTEDRQRIQAQMMGLGGGDTPDAREKQQYYPSAGQPYLLGQTRPNASSKAPFGNASLFTQSEVCVMPHAQQQKQEHDSRHAYGSSDHSSDHSDDCQTHQWKRAAAPRQYMLPSNAVAVALPPPPTAAELQPPNSPLSPCTATAPASPSARMYYHLPQMASHQPQVRSYEGGYEYHSQSQYASPVSPSMPVPRAYN
ncbi:hypothetical protein K437DRAFT_263199 [Tilletiaria anomala UBC 951]|uniref:Uncharacterized protein n=1 Tax=Tilletiaria anomala (strain ATCC 24038 / CBS 436.72 / UBC 951) TaxID=1037660 RepID=A0A066W0G5_TILAU|nr:uncharacterized protein K437DRAFT_263199 [Tilletiaria anomala UBC 951]KDN44559.1 hypothetical protein K437DRAFT_263199 [Tilletiaria anomala UBC 951]